MSRAGSSFSAGKCAASCVLVATLAAAPAALAGVNVASDASTLSTQPARLGPADSAATVQLAIVLPSRDPAGLAAFASRVSQPGDPLFRHYLQPAGFAVRFGAKPEDYRAVAAWARSQGLVPGEEYAAHTVLPVSGSVRAVEAAFHVALVEYRDASGETFYAADRAPQMPAALAGKISSALGFNTFTRNAVLAHALPAGQTSNAAGSGPGGGYSASDLRTAYNVPAAPQGAPGETLAVFEQGFFPPSDIATYLTANKLPNVPVRLRPSYVHVGATSPVVQFQGAIDVDMAIAMNPKLRQVLVYVQTSPDFGVAVVNGLAAMANDDLAQTIAVSYGIDEVLQDAPAIPAENTILQQMAAQGQSVFISAGNYGAYGRSIVGHNVADPGAQPFATSVGGTTLLTGQSADYQKELVWNELGSTGFATGGGASKKWDIPAWQVVSGISVAAQNGGSSKRRNVPDVTAVADPFTGVSVYSAANGGWRIAGGTGDGTAIWAGYTSVMNATSKALGLGQIGFANPTLYKVGESNDYSNFHDIVDGDNGDIPQFHKPGFSAGEGYDNVGGWGSPSAGTAANWVLLPASGNTHPPPAPGGLSGTAAETSVTLQWHAAKGATGYLVETANQLTGAPGRSVFALANVAKVSGLTPNTAYTFDVASISPGGVTRSAKIQVTTRPH
jgi:kumamolisin